MKWKGRKGSSNVVDNRRSYSNFVSDLGKKLAVRSKPKPFPSKPKTTSNRGRNKNNGDKPRDYHKSTTYSNDGPAKVTTMKPTTIGKSSQHGTGYGPRTRKRR